MRQARIVIDETGLHFYGPEHYTGTIYGRNMDGTTFRFLMPVLGIDAVIKWPVW